MMDSHLQLCRSLFLQYSSIFPTKIFSFLELTPHQIDHLLHTVDSLDEDRLQEMHAEFLELW